MKKEDIRLVLANYDANKGFFRKIFGDQGSIKRLRVFYNSLPANQESLNENQQIQLVELLNLDNTVIGHLSYSCINTIKEKFSPGKLKFLSYLSKKNQLTEPLLKLVNNQKEITTLSKVIEFYNMNFVATHENLIHLANNMDCLTFLLPHIKNNKNFCKFYLEKIAHGTRYTPEIIALNVKHDKEIRKSFKELDSNGILTQKTKEIIFNKPEFATLLTKMLIMLKRLDLFNNDMLKIFDQDLPLHKSIDVHSITEDVIEYAFSKLKDANILTLENRKYLLSNIINMTSLSDILILLDQHQLMTKKYLDKFQQLHRAEMSNGDYYPSKSIFNFLNQFKDILNESILDEIISQHQAGFRRNFIDAMEHAKFPITQEEKLFLLKNAKYADDIVMGINSLLAANIASEENKSFLYNNPQFAYKIGWIMRLLQNSNHLTPHVLQEIYDNPAKFCLSTPAIALLNSYQLLTSQNLSSLFANSQYAGRITCALEIIGTLTQESIDAIFREPHRAIEVAETITNRKYATLPSYYYSHSQDILKEYTKSRIALKVLIHNRKDSSNIFNSLPLEISEHIANLAGEINKNCRR